MAAAPGDVVPAPPCLLPPLLLPLLPFMVGLLLICCSWCRCRQVRNSVRLSVLPLFRSAVPNTAASCESRDSCRR